MTLDDIVNDVSVKLNLPKGLVDKTYRAYWKAVREHIESLPLKEDLSEEEFMELQPNVNIPSIGKLNVTLDRYKGVKQYYKIFLERIYKNATHNKD